MLLRFQDQAKISWDPCSTFLADHSPPLIQLIVQTKTGDSLPYSRAPACWGKILTRDIALKLWHKTILNEGFSIGFEVNICPTWAELREKEGLYTREETKAGSQWKFLNIEALKCNSQKVFPKSRLLLKPPSSRFLAGCWHSMRTLIFT